MDGARVRARRLELGLSERRLVARLGTGFTQTILRNLEAGANHSDLTLGELDRLAEQLNLPLRELLPATTATAEGNLVDRTPLHGPVPAEEHLDRAVTLIGAVLTEVGRAMPEQTLADLADLHLDEVPQVLEQLDRRLRPAGLRLHRVRPVGGEVGIRPAEQALGADRAREPWRLHLAQVSLNVGQVSVLAKALRGEAERALGNDQRVRAAELVNAGILVRPLSGDYALSTDARFSLLDLSC